MKIYFTIIFSILFSLFSPAQDTADENLRIAVEFNRKSEFETSLLFCNKALDINPNLVSAFFLRGINNYNLDNFDDAVVDFTVVIRLKPDYVEAYYQRAKARQAKNDFIGAVQDFNRARELNPGKATLYIVKSFLSSIFTSKQSKKGGGK